MMIKNNVNFKLCCCLTKKIIDHNKILRIIHSERVTNKNEGIHLNLICSFVLGKETLSTCKE